MPRYLIAGWIWAAFVCSMLVAAFFAAGGFGKAAASLSISTGLHLKTSPIAVPIFSDRVVVGYAITRIAYLPDSSMHDPTSSPLEAVFRNAFHAMVYNDPDFDPAHFPKVSAEELAAQMRSNVNELFGYEAVTSLQLEYVYYSAIEAGSSGNKRKIIQEPE